MNIYHITEVNYPKSYKKFKEGFYVENLFRECCIELIKSLSNEKLHTLFNKEIIQSSIDLYEDKETMRVSLKQKFNEPNK